MVKHVAMKAFDGDMDVEMRPGSMDAPCWMQRSKKITFSNGHFGNADGQIQRVSGAVVVILGGHSKCCCWGWPARCVRSSS